MSDAVKNESESQFWRASAPLILASKSVGRRLALEQTAIPFVVSPADVDERALEAEIVGSGGGADAVVLTLSSAKALALSRRNPESYVVGADQAASCEGELFGKPESLEAAERQLRRLSGRRHRLHSGFALALGGRILFETVAYADLKTRALSEEFLAAYLAAMGEAALTSAGAYQIEGIGVHLFERIEGDHWTVLGLPLLPLLEALRRERALLG
ncbi:MAG TPA: Maf family protein [Methylocystis sp.]|nr:Maf family protein [Methylocystis sp.]